MTLRYLTAGESHGPALLAILDGLPAGIDLPESVINAQLARRQRGYGAGARMKIEADRVRLLGGVLAGQTTGAPLGMLIENRDHHNWAGKAVPPYSVPRPGHVDLAAALKYGYQDLRPGLERASARETAARVAVGAACRQFLLAFGITLGGYVRSIGSVEAPEGDRSLAQRAQIAEENDLRAPDLASAEAMRMAVEGAIKTRDTLGGTIEVFALGLPPGLGSHVQWDRRLTARLAQSILAVQAIKGVEFGPAFENARQLGSRVQDPISLEDQRLRRPSNRAGGIEGGISNGQPLRIRAAMKPIATTLTPQRSVDLASGQPAETNYERSDFCPVPRAVPILEAVVAYVLAAALIEKLGGDSLAEMLPRFASLRQARLEDLPQSGGEHRYWPGEED